MQALGIDVGATGIKGCVVDTLAGNLVYEKFKIKTPNPATPEAVIDCIQAVIDNFEWQGKPLGIGFPSIIKNGYSLTASNIDAQFINYPIQEKFEEAFKCQVKVLNDADAAGVAEMTHGSGKDWQKGVVVLITLGTGIGSAIFLDGKLLPNTELGHLNYKKSVFEKYASNSARELKKMGWKSWGNELNNYLNHLNLLFSPDIIMIGGGVSKHFANYKDYLIVDTKVETAKLLNDAGIIGAAMSLQ